MTFRSIITSVVFASTLTVAGTAQAELGGFTFPTVTWADEFTSVSKDRAKAPACTKAACEAPVKR